MPRLVGSRSASPLVAIGVGVVLGSALRNLPISIVDLALAPDRGAMDCGAEAAADCAVRVAPFAIIEVARFGLAVLVVALSLALVGSVGTASGWHRLRGAPPTVAGHRVGSSSRADYLALSRVACGITLMMPALWLAASFVATVAS